MLGSTSDLGTPSLADINRSSRDTERAETGGDAEGWNPSADGVISHDFLIDSA